MFNFDFFRQSSLMGTTLCAAPSKSYAFSTNYHACIAMPTWPRCAPPILCWPWPPYNLLPRSCLTCFVFCRSSLMGTTLCAAPSKSYAFSTNYHACIAMPTWPRCAPPILCWPWPPYNLLPRSCLTCFFFVDPHWWVPLIIRATPSKSYAFSTNYHACIAMPTWPRCAPPILCWPWPPYNLFPRSCLTWIFSVNFYWWVQLCVQRPAKSMPFQQIIMHALQCQHDLDVHLLFYFDLDLHTGIPLPEVVFNLDLFCRSWLMGTTLRAAPIKSHAFSTNYHACIAMPTWHRCAPPILFWPWSPYNLLPRSCFTSSSILTDGYHFACSAQQKPCTCLLNKLSCMHCNPSMM